MIKNILVGGFSAILSFVMIFGDSSKSTSAPKEVKIAEVKTVEELCEQMPLNKRIIKLEKTLHIQNESNDN